MGRDARPSPAPIHNTALNVGRVNVNGNVNVDDVGWLGIDESGRLPLPPGPGATIALSSEPPMSIVERDYFLRMIQRLAEAIARAARLRNVGQLDDALRVVRETVDALFGPLARTLDALDPQGAASLLGDRHKIAAYAALTAEEAAIHEARGEPKRARPTLRRALALYLESVVLAGGADVPTRDAITALRLRVDAARLPERYRNVLDKLG